MDEKLKQFLPLLQFNNRLKDVTANYISITNQYLWRRDAARLVAFKLPQKISGHFDYEIKDISQKQIKNLIFQKNQALTLQTYGETYTVKPEDKTIPSTLNYMLQQKEEASVQVEMDRKRLKEIMLILEQKCGISNHADPKIVFNFEGNEIFIKDRTDVFEIPITKSIKNNEGIFAYSFYLLKDVIYNNYKENIFFSIFDNYMKLTFSEDAWAVLMGCHLDVNELFGEEEEEIQQAEN